MSNYRPRHRNDPVQRSQQWSVFATIHCQTRRQFNLSVNYHGLAMAMRKAFALDWPLCLEYSRYHVDAWLLREERQAHASLREGVGV